MGPGSRPSGALVSTPDPRVDGRVGVVGAGAVGASLVAMMLDAGLPVSVIAEGARALRLRDAGLAVNGTTYHPPVDEQPEKGSYSLIVVVTKSTQLDDALPLIVRAAGRQGLVMSLLNGISSEAIIRDALRMDGAPPDSVARRVVPAMILGIDATRMDEGVTYLNRGTVYFGSDPITAPVPAESLDSVERVFAAAAIPTKRSRDIMRTLWWKFMINVGINQASAILRAPYGLFQRSAAAQDLMVCAMEEVLALSEREGVGLTRSDIDEWIATLAGLNPEAKTSMVQDVEAGRPTEVDLFAGTVLELAQRHGVQTPVNRVFYQMLSAMEE